MIEFFGHLHPVIVHLPIGFLLVALLLQYLSRKKKYYSIKPVVPIVLLLGSMAAITACITGYLLSINDDYDTTLVSWHMWMAIGVVLVSLILYTKEVNPKVEVSKKLLSAWLLVLIMITGHLGGSLTHGSDYLTKPLSKTFSGDTIVTSVIKPLANVQEAFVYKDIIQPILQTKCYSCHNENKQKGKLRMDDISLLIKGGKHGTVINLLDVDSSTMLQRLLLPTDNDKHMPPKEKPQPTEAQIALLHWWISHKADFTLRVKDIEQPDKIKPILLALQTQKIIQKEAADIPLVAVDKADSETIAQLRKMGWLILPVSQKSNYLSASYTNADTITVNSLQLINKLSKQLIFLKINSAILQHEALPIISKLSNLRRLNLANTNITDKQLQQLTSLQKLQHLNLVGTKVSAQGVLALREVKDLAFLYLYQSDVHYNDTGRLRTAFVKTTIDFGNYIVPLLETDTTIVKQKKTN